MAERETSSRAVPVMALLWASGTFWIGAEWGFGAIGIVFVATAFMLAIDLSFGAINPPVTITKEKSHE